MSGLYPGAPQVRDVPFSDDVRDLLALADGNAAQLRNEYLGTEHVVLAMTEHPNAAALLARLGVAPDRVSATLHRTVRPGSATPETEVRRPYTSRTRQSFGLALQYAQSCGRAEVTIADLLVGLLRERMNVGAQVLQHYGLSEEQAAAELREPGGGESSGSITASP